MSCPSSLHVNVPQRVASPLQTILGASQSRQKLLQVNGWLKNEEIHQFVDVGRWSRAEVAKLSYHKLCRTLWYLQSQVVGIAAARLQARREASANLER